VGNLLDNPVLSKEWLLAGRVYIVCCTNQAKSAVLHENTSMQQLAFDRCWPSSVWLLNACLLVLLWTLRAKCVLSLICNSAVLWYKMEVLGIESSGPLNVYKCVPVSSEGCIWWGTVAQAVSFFPCQLTFALALFSLSNMSGAIVQGSFPDDYF